MRRWFFSYPLATRAWMIAALFCVILFLILWLLPFLRTKRRLGDPSWHSPLALCAGCTLACLLALLGQLQGWHSALTAVIALLAGLFGYGAVTYGNIALYRLLQEQSVEVSDLIGQSGMVWVPIPNNGVGKVQLLTRDKVVEIDAQCENGASKEIGMQVTVLRQEGNIFIVK